MKLFPLLTPAGSDSEIQYNNGGLFGGDSSFTFNDTTKALTLLGAFELGDASDTTLARVSAGAVSIEGVNIAMAGGAFHDGFSDFVANEHVDHSGVTLTAGKGLSGGGDISANRTFAFDLAEMTGNVAWNDGSTDASITWTFALSGANDPVWTIGSNSMDLTTGALKQGGTQVMLVGDAATAHSLLDGSVHSDSVADAVTRGSIIFGNATPKWDELVIGAADTFLGSDGTDVSYRTAAQTMASLSGSAGVGFSFNSQALTSVGAIGCAAITGTSTALFDGASVSIGKANTTTGTLVLYDSNSANTITFTVPDISAGALSFTLPATDGDNTNVLQTDGNGVLTWVAAGGGAANPAGADTQVQYNDGGVFGADATFNFNDATKVLDVDALTITGVIATGIDMSGGTFATATQNWPTTPVIQANGTQIIKFDDTNYNIIMGSDAFNNSEGTDNIGIGFQAGYNNDSSGSGGIKNVYIGYYAGRGGAGGSTGQKNVAIGRAALQSVTSGTSNFALGGAALGLVTNADYNVAIGESAFHDLTSGDNNVAIGYRAGWKSTSGIYNTFIGSSTGYNTTGSGGRNVAIGGYAFHGNSGGSYNTVIGVSAGRGSGHKSYNTFIGNQAGYAATTGYSNVFIGRNAGYRQTSNSDLLIIDNRDQGSTAAETTDCLMYGVFHATPASQSLRLNIGNLYLGNPTHSDADGGGLITQTFIREDGSGTATSAASIAVSHDGAGANDQLGKIVVNVNTGAGLVEGIRLDSNLLTTLAGALKIVGDVGFHNTTPIAQEAHIVDADGTLADITTKFNALLLSLETYGLLAAA